MTKFSICIPVEPGHVPPVFLAREILKDPEADLEIVVAPYDDTCADATELYAMAAADARLRILPPAPQGISAAQLWIGLVRAAVGDWVTIVRPEDIIETNIAPVLTYIEKTMPTVDAYGWNALQIAADAPRHVKSAIAIPIQHHSIEIEKATMLEAFFFWVDSNNTPKMPFGLYHCAIKRSLLQSVLDTSGEMSWLTPLPQYEWAARVLLMANALGFSARPLSAVNVTPYQPVAVKSAIDGFPFNASIGLTAAIAEIQLRVLRDLGADWTGFNEDFVNACMRDCVLEHGEEAFEAKCQAYYQAIGDMQGGRLAPLFRPPYLAEPQPDRRRGLHGKTLLVDRFIGNATDAQSFFKVIHSMMTPLFVVAGGEVATDPSIAI